ncbi:MAG TPA: hypothetical protein VFJ02_15330 [Vicinamibacterales bacterium]|nr:hypothetical protein [Vicinamibacterales bacterium]
MVVVLWGLITHGTYAGSGDEPHYLAIAHSIAFDGDVDLANNYGANEPLIGGGQLQPEAHVRAGVDGVARPVHDIGMPLVFAPYVRVAAPVAHALASAIPATIMRRARLNEALLYRHLLSFAMIALAAVLAGWMFDALVQLGAAPRAAFAGTLLVVLSPPLLIFSVLFFTELLSALLLFYVFRQIAIDNRHGAARWAIAGIVTGFLFLVHARNIGLVVPLALIALATRGGDGRRREQAAYVVGLAAMVALRTFVNYRFWGEWLTNPHARVSGWPGLGDVVLESAARLRGLLVDQEFGLLPYAPIYLIAIAGAAVLLKSRRDVLTTIAIVTTVYVGMIVCPITNVHGWTGGWSPAGRFLTPVLPLVGLLVVIGMRPLPRALLTIAVVLQLIIDGYAWQHPKILWNDGDGRAAFFDER